MPKAGKPAPSPRFGGSPTHRSLERGIEILRACRPGSEWLGNGELAERTGLSRPTISRLTQTLAGTGYLEHDPDLRMYRLGVPVLSLAHAMYAGSSVLQAAIPLMRAMATKLRINVGLAAPDGTEMIYLDSIRYNRRESLRNVVPGQRIPMELTSLGRAYLAVAPQPTRIALLKHFRAKRPDDWKTIDRQIADAMESIRTRGFCTASWQPEVVALASPVVIEGRAIYCLNFSLATKEPPSTICTALRRPLLALAQEVSAAIVNGTDR